MLTERTRYRLIGTIFLVAVAAVVLPMLFDGEGVAPMQLDPVPPADFQVQPDATPPPDMTPALEARRELLGEIDADGYATDTGTRFGEPVLLEEPVLVEESVRQETPSTNVGAEGEAPPTGTPPMGELKWAVQVASFTQAENATAMRDRLVGDGYTAFLSNAKRDGQAVTRVAVGPFINRDDATSEKDEIDRRYDVRAAIVRFTY